MEFIFVIKRYDLFDLEFPHGFERHGADALRSLYLDRIEKRGFFAERRYCEQDSGFKQIIPYAIVVHGDRVFLLRRFASQGESRLHNKMSIGVGGHINPIDGVENFLEAGCEREIAEELEITEDIAPRPVGIINDESNAVGSVHLGIVHLVRLEKGAVKVRETDMMEGSFVPLGELKRLAQDPACNIETWSSLIIEKIDTIL